MKQATFKMIVKWLGIIVIAHFAVRFIFAILFAKDMMLTEEWEPEKAYRSLLNLCILLQLAFAAIYTWFESYFKDKETFIKNKLKEQPELKLLSLFRQNYLKDNLIRIAVFGIFQLPFTLLYALFGISLKNTSFLLGFYILDAGTYAATGSVILGFILNPLIFGIFLILCQYISLVIAHRNMKQIY